MQNAARFLQGKTHSNWRFPIDFPSTKINLESPGSQPEPLLKADAPDGVSIGRSSCLDGGMGAMELPGRTVEVCGDKISINIQMVLLW